MQKTVLEYLEFSAKKYRDKIAFEDENTKITFLQLQNDANAIGSRLLKLNRRNSPIAVYLPKCCDCISSFMGIATSGNFYCPIDISMPLERAQIIIGVLNPIAIITTKKLYSHIQKLQYEGEIIFLEEAKIYKVNLEKIKEVKNDMVDIDPLYVLFTSGSTGIPKGVLVSHKSVIDYIDWVSETFQINYENNFGNQAPFYFDNSILDIYCALKNGSTVFIIPKKKFMFPRELIQYLNDNKINIIFWVPSILCNIVDLKGLENCIPQYLQKVLFCGEVMPNKQLNIWRKYLPEALYANLYGPTEITDVCTYYLVDRKFADDEPLPIGLPCNNTKILVLNDKDELVENDEVGELCVSGSCLALGYYNNWEKTKEVFVQNPLNNVYEEKIYRTGDIVKYNEKGELIYICRKDFQIKHMGHRIELGEIETIANGIKEIESCVCLYDSSHNKIIMCYKGDRRIQENIKKLLKNKLPLYMIPNLYIWCSEFPYNANGKIDRPKLLEMVKERNH